MLSRHIMGYNRQVIRDPIVTLITKSIRVYQSTAIIVSRMRNQRADRDIRDLNPI